MKTLDIEIAVMQKFGVRKHIIVPNVAWGITREGIGNLHESDLLILTQSNYAIEIEIKISKGDLLKDADKPHAHDSNFIKKLYFAIPETLLEIAKQSIPKRAGIIIVKNKTNDVGLETEVVRKAKTNTDSVQWTEDERNQLMRLGCMRILGLKKKLARKVHKKSKVY